MRDHDHADLVGTIKRSLMVQRLLYKTFGQERPTIQSEDADLIRSALQPEIEKAGALIGLDLCRRWGWTPT